MLHIYLRPQLTDPSEGAEKKQNTSSLLLDLAALEVVVKTNDFKMLFGTLLSIILLADKLAMFLLATIKAFFLDLFYTEVFFFLTRDYSSAIILCMIAVVTICPARF